MSEINTNEVTTVVGQTTASGGEIFNDYEHNIADASLSHAEGEMTTANGRASHAEGRETLADETGAHAEGWGSSAMGHGSHAENYSTAEGDYSHSEGYLTTSSGIHSHAEGFQSVALGEKSHSEGQSTTASGKAAHSEGSNTTASGEMSHAEGRGTYASGDGAHAEGWSTVASGTDSHAEGQSTQALGARTHTSGLYTIAGYKDQTVIGTFNQNKSDTLFEVGNGSSNSSRSNAFEVRKDGTISVGGMTITPEQFRKLAELALPDSTGPSPYSIAMFPETLTICVGNTEQLTALPRPLDSVYDKIVWSVNNEDIVSVDNNGNITAKAAGKAVVTATVICNDIDKTEYSAKCFVTVEDQVIIERVIVVEERVLQSNIYHIKRQIMREGDEIPDDAYSYETTRVYFKSTGHDWLCVGEDQLYDGVALADGRVLGCTQHNCYTNDMAPNSVADYHGFKRYHDNEINLLYAVDPHGVAKYVHEYAMENGESTQGKINIKDEFFKKIFNNREPSYFLYNDGMWYEVNKNEVDFDNDHYYSESETFFGAHSIYIGQEILVSAIDFVVSVITFFLPGKVADCIVETLGELLKFGVFVYYSDMESALKEALSVFYNDTENDKDKTPIDYTFEVLGVFESLAALINSLKPMPIYFQEITKYCVENFNFNIYIRLGDGSLNKLSDINELVWG